jgi:formate dehydrogenase subunit gamma
MTQGFDRETTREIIAGELGREGPLLPILHGLQAAFGHVPDEAVPMVADALNLTRAEVHGVVTFYHDFRHAPAGRRLVKLCRAEACQARGCEAVAARAEVALGIKTGETSADGRVTLEAVYCLGLCASGPAALIDGVAVARLEGRRLEKLLAELLG